MKGLYGRDKSKFKCSEKTICQLLRLSLVKSIAMVIANHGHTSKHGTRKLRKCNLKTKTCNV